MLYTSTKSDIGINQDWFEMMPISLDQLHSGLISLNEAHVTLTVCPVLTMSKPKMRHLVRLSCIQRLF